MGVDEARLVATTLTGETLATTTLAYADPPKPPPAWPPWPKPPVADPGPRPARPARAGRGRGLHGGVDESLRLLHFAPNLGWRNVPVGQWLRQGLAGHGLGRPAAAGAERSRHGRAGRT